MDGESFKIETDFGAIDEMVARSIEKFGQLAVDAIDAMNQINDFVIDEMTVAFQAGMESIAKTFDWMSEQATKAFGAITTAASATWAAITGGLSAIPGMITGAFSAVLSPIKTVFNGIWSAAKTVTGWITGAFSTVAGFISNTFSGAYGVVKEMLPLAGVGFFAGLSAGFKELTASEQAFTRVSAAVKSTGQVAGFTAEQLAEMASQMESNTRFGDDVAQQAQAVALQFKNVRGNVFADALKVSADAAINWGMDLTAATEKVTSALDDPLAGFQKLAREGTKFSEAEKRQIETMVQFGNVAGAQRIILNRLSDQVGGAATADAKTFSGAMAQVNNAMGDAWKAIAGALTPAVQALGDWFLRGAKVMESWGPGLKTLIEETMNWATQSSGFLSDWAEKAQEYFMVAFDFAIDAATKAFTFIETALGDMPGFMEAAKAKFNLYWEQISQFIRQTWETIDVSLRNIWDDLVQYMMSKFSTFTNYMANKIANMPGFADWFGVSQEDLNETLREMQGAGMPGRGPRATAKGQTDEEKARLAELREAADAAGNAFGAKFGENFEKNKAIVDAFRVRIQKLFGLEGESLDMAAKKSAEEFVLNKEGKDAEEKSSAGQFEDLLSLQKRITGAAAAKSPEAKATETQTGILVSQFKAMMQQSDKNTKELKGAIDQTTKAVDEQPAAAVAAP